MWRMIAQPQNCFVFHQKHMVLGFRFHYESAIFTTYENQGFNKGLQSELKNNAAFHESSKPSRYSFNQINELCHRFQRYVKIVRKSG